jgi:hypothetical protein
MSFAITFLTHQKGKNMKTLGTKTDHDHLAQYTASVHGLHAKIALVVDKQKDVAQSLGRAAAALRSIGALNNRERNPSFGKNYSFSQENFLGKNPK